VKAATASLSRGTAFGRGVVSSGELEAAGVAAAADPFGEAGETAATAERAIVAEIAGDAADALTAAAAVESVERLQPSTRVAKRPHVGTRP
jgi:hypothetical protein